MKKYKALCDERLNNLIRLVQGKLGKSDRKKIITVITMDVHSRDVVARLVKEKQKVRIHLHGSNNCANIG